MPLIQQVRPDIYDLSVDILRHRLKLLEVGWTPPPYKRAFAMSDEFRNMFYECFYIPNEAINPSEDLLQRLSAPIEVEEVWAKVLMLFFRGATRILDNRPVITCQDIFNLIYWVCGIVTYLRFSPKFCEASRLASVLLAVYLDNFKAVIDGIGGWGAFLKERLQGLYENIADVCKREEEMDFLLEFHVMDVFRDLDIDLR